MGSTSRSAQASAAPAAQAITMTQPILSSSPASSMLKQPSKSILKTPSTAIGQKRKMIDMDLPSATSGSQSQSQSESCSSSEAERPRKKRARVTFEMDLPASNQECAAGQDQMQGPNGAVDRPASTEKSAALVREEVRRAIQRHLAGDSDAYDRIKEIFTADPTKLEDDGSPVYDLPTHASLKNHLQGLQANVAALDGNCNGLVHAVLSSQWIGRDEKYVKQFVRFLGTLAVAKGAYLNSVLKMLVGNLKQLSHGIGQLPGYTAINTEEIYNRVHFAINHIVQLIPAGSVALAPILSSSFPNETDNAKTHIAYTRNLLQMVDYAPELRADILALITDKLVKIDVQVQVDMEDFEEDVEEEILQSTSAEAIALGDEEEPDDDDLLSEDGILDPEEERVKMVKENILKIDCIMDMLFEYYAIPFTSGSLDEKESTLDLLLAHFENIILPTYRSRHSQFLLFHYAQSSPILVDRFATTCVQIIVSKSYPSLIRQYAAAYLASFVARGAHVSSEVIRDVFDLLGTHMQNLMTDYEPNCRGPDLRRYGTFYATVQAMLYIFCFRWAHLTTAALEDENGSPPENLELDQVSFPPNTINIMREAIFSKLNPLKVCSPAIVTEFARLSHHLNFVYVYSKLETNKRVRVHSFRGFGSMTLNAQFGQIERETRADDDQGSQLDAYFPFDPYQLARSKRWLEDDYVVWRGVPGLDDQEDDDMDDTDSRGGDDDDEMDDDEVDTETDSDDE